MGIWLVLLAVGASCAIAHSADAGDKDNPPDKQSAPFKITLRKGDDWAGTWMKDDVVVFSLKSPSGISQAVIQRQNARWPKVVVVYLHLQGLEHLQINNGTDTLHATMRVVDGQPRMRQGKGDKETQRIQRTDPLWMNICPMGADGKPATKFPLTDGYFEITFPSAFFETNPKSITLHWIDFYRE